MFVALLSKLIMTCVCCETCQMETPAVTTSSDSVFHSVEDCLDDVFYEEPMPTSAVVTAVDDFPAVRFRHNRENPHLYAEAESSKQLHPLSAAYYEMPTTSDDRYIHQNVGLTLSFTDMFAYSSCHLVGYCRVHFRLDT